MDQNKPVGKPEQVDTVKPAQLLTVLLKFLRNLQALRLLIDLKHFSNLQFTQFTDHVLSWATGGQPCILCLCHVFLLYLHPDFTTLSCSLHVPCGHRAFAHAALSAWNTAFPTCRLVNSSHPSPLS